MNNKYQKLENFFKLYTTLATSFLLALFVTSVFFPVLPSGAVTCTNGSTGETGQVCDTASSDISVTVENPYYITVTSSAGSGSGVALNYTNDSGNNLGNVIAAADTVTTTSNTGRLKHLYISTISSSSNNLVSDNTDLDNNKTYIAAGGGNTIDAATALSDNTWGFALPSTTSGIPDNTFDTSYDTSSLSSTSKFTKVPTLGNDILIQEEIGTENAETGEYESTATVYYGTLATTDIYAGSYSNTIKYTAFTTEPPDVETRTIEDITYMQEMSKDICDNTPESTTYGQYTLIDKRGRGNNGEDDGTYTIVKAKDGNCWMTDNLNLYGMTISADYSDFSAGTYTIPDTSTWNTNLYTEPRVHRVTNSGYTDVVYYNWTSAVALLDGSTTEQQDQSICPKNWQLPVDGDTNQNKSYAKLLNTYGVTTGARLLSEPTLGFTQYYGYWSWYYNREYYQGVDSILWSSTTDGAGNARSLGYDSSVVLPRRSDDKGYGFSIRCVNRD